MPEPESHSDPVPIALKTETIDLDQFLKLAGTVGSGGEAKWLIREGLVRVNGQVETRRRRTLKIGDRVEVPEAGAFVLVGADA
ncbi:MAG: RNA-binding S4 domain-containing protein [Phycisphaeraceae bacterium]|nr:RNA-binding S4 domain-containing protein [Phycisphaeraceae bacterium]